MHAIITDGSISKIINHPKRLVIGDVQYPARIFSVWTASELAAIGIIGVTFDDSKKKDEQWYINTNQTYTYDADAGTVTATYGDATARAHADTLFSAQDETDGLGTEGEVATRGLKYNLIKIIKSQAAGILADTDWYIIRKADANTAIPSTITNHRAAVRTKAAQMETAITNASDTPALETLYKRNENSVRPLGELPRLES